MRKRSVKITFEQYLTGESTDAIQVKGGDGGGVSCISQLYSIAQSSTYFIFSCYVNAVYLKHKFDFAS